MPELDLNDITTSDASLQKSMITLMEAKKSIDAASIPRVEKIFRHLNSF
jgi:hypothetical protein